MVSPELSVHGFVKNRRHRFASMLNTKKKIAVVALFSMALTMFYSIETAKAENAGGLQAHCDLVSAYVTKGSDYGDSPAVQPEVTYTFSGSGIVAGVWSSIALLEHDGVRYKEIDPYILFPVGPLSIIVTDYYLPQLGDLFDYSNTPDGPNTLEISALYTRGNLSLYGAVEVGGYDFDKARYIEAKYTVYDKGGYTAKAFAGAGDELMYAPGKGDDFALVNLGLTVSKAPFSVSCIVNPDTGKSYLVFKASF
jgi:hypothetical protein